MVANTWLRGVLAGAFVVAGTVVPSQSANVATVAQLKTAVADANGGGDKTILLAKGSYTLDSILRISADGVTLAGATGKRGDVIIDCNYGCDEIFQIVGSSTTVRDMTLKRAYYHPIHIYPYNHDVTGTKIINVHIIDPGQQAIKINQDGGKLYSVVSGVVRGSRIELTSAGRDKVWQINNSCYTGGVDGHHTFDWHIQDNHIEGFWCAGGLSEHGVHFWSFSEDSMVERNTIVNCDRGIGFGLGTSGHIGGVIRNNMIYHDAGHKYSDVGIGLENATGAQVYNNTIFHEHDYANAIEYRFAGTSGGLIVNNLTNRAIVSRDGGSARVEANVVNALANWFVTPTSGDLHLSYGVTKVVDQGQGIAGLVDDFDGDDRPMGKGIDIGADEIYQTAAGHSAVVAPWLHLLNK